jgi:hypothetical protein
MKYKFYHVNVRNKELHDLFDLHESIGKSKYFCNFSLPICSIESTESSRELSRRSLDAKVGPKGPLRVFIEVEDDIGHLNVNPSVSPMYVETKYNAASRKYIEPMFIVLILLHGAAMKRLTLLPN